jgi:hypothetical protein
MRRIFFLLPLLVLMAVSPLPTASLASAGPGAGNIQLKFTITRNGQAVSHPEVQVELNHTATVIQQEIKNPNRYKIEVTPSLDASSAIHLEFRISEISGKETTLLSTPSVIVFAGDSADVVQKKARSDELKIRVTPLLN